MKFRRTPEQKAAATARAEHNAQFNTRDTDPDSPEYLASHDRVIAAENEAENARR